MATIMPVGKTRAYAQSQLSTEFLTEGTNLYLALYYDIPTALGVGTEVDLTGYARVLVATGSTNWEWSNTNNAIRNVNLIQFPLITGGDMFTTLYARALAVISNAGAMQRIAPFIKDTVPFNSTGVDDIFTSIPNTLTNDMVVTVWGDNLPTGLSAFGDYYIISKSGNTFKLSATKGGTQVNITTDGSGFIAKANYMPLVLNGQPVIEAGTLKFMEG